MVCSLWPLFCFWVFLQNSRSSISCFCIPLFLVIKMLFAMGDDLSYGLNTLGPLCLWQCLQNSRSGISYFRIPVFLVIGIVFHFTPRIPTILLWPSASATCIYDIDYELQGIALNWHYQSYWVDIIISQSHISKVSQSCRMYVGRYRDRDP